MLQLTIITMVSFADESRQDDTLIMCINISTTAVFVGVFIALVKRWVYVDADVNIVMHMDRVLG